jgi:hypothetical protein
MHRTLLTTSVAVLALALAPTIAQASLKDSAHGTGTYAGTDATFDFDAHSDALGGQPTGHFRFDSQGTLLIRGAVNCLTVVGITAIVGGVVREAGAGAEFLIGRQVTFTVQDNGTEGSGDLISLVTPLATGLCSPLSPDHLIENGDIVVVDSPCESVKDKPGTDKDKCKNHP